MHLPGPKPRRFKCKNGCGTEIKTTSRNQKYCGPCSQLVKAKQVIDWHKNPANKKIGHQHDNTK